MSTKENRFFLAILASALWISSFIIAKIAEVSNADSPLFRTSAKLYDWSIWLVIGCAIGMGALGIGEELLRIGRKLWQAFLTRRVAHLDGRIFHVQGPNEQEHFKPINVNCPSIQPGDLSWAEDVVEEAWTQQSEE